MTAAVGASIVPAGRLETPFGFSVATERKGGVTPGRATEADVAAGGAASSAVSGGIAAAGIVGLCIRRPGEADPAARRLVSGNLS